jgi:1,4-alpha-glucan branching enzyme
MGREFIYRRWHHNQLTFSMMYAFTERFILPLSHDEVVHGKHSLIDRMPGDYWQRFACLRTLYIYHMTHPGGKLMFMGGEFGQFIEWRFNEQLEWFLLAYESHRNLQSFVRQLNHLYRDHAALWEQDMSWEGFNWLNADDSQNSVYSYLRRSAGGEILIVVLNMTPSPLPGYTLTVPMAGCYLIEINSDESVFGGSGYPTGSWTGLYDTARLGDYRAEADSDANESDQEHPDQLIIDIPPLCGLIMRRQTSEEFKKTHGRKTYGSN